jgi:hypothetical protein
MKLLNPATKILAVIVLCFIIFTGCKKNEAQKVLSNEEFIEYTINGVQYKFIMPLDSVYSDSVLETSSFVQLKNVFANRVPTNNTDICRIDFLKAGIALGSAQKLNSFYTLQTNFYPYFTTSSNNIYVNITEYGLVNEYMAGNFSALLTGSPPTNTTYNVDCKFRVRRRL